jgi:hypothetical protein
MKFKKGYGVTDLVPLIIVVVVVALVGGIGANILSSVQADQTADTQAYNASSAGLEGIGNFSGNLPLIATVIVSALLIGILVVAFRTR